MMAMALPAAKGAYVLIASVAQMKRMEIGRLGAYDLIPAFYAVTPRRTVFLLR